MVSPGVEHNSKRIQWPSKEGFCKCGTKIIRRYVPVYEILGCLLTSWMWGRCSTFAGIETEMKNTGPAVSCSCQLQFHPRWRYNAQPTYSSTESCALWARWNWATQQVCVKKIDVKSSCKLNMVKNNKFSIKTRPSPSGSHVWPRPIWAVAIIMAWHAELKTCTILCTKNHLAHVSWNFVRIGTTSISNQSEMTWWKRSEFTPMLICMISSWLSGDSTALLSEKGDKRSLFSGFEFPEPPQNQPHELFWSNQDSFDSKCCSAKPTLQICTCLFIFCYGVRPSFTRPISRELSPTRPTFWEYPNNFVLNMSINHFKIDYRCNNPNNSQLFSLTGSKKSFDLQGRHRSFFSSWPEHGNVSAWLLRSKTPARAHHCLPCYGCEFFQSGL